MKSKEMSNELLVVLGSRDKQWSVLEKVTVRNQQNGLVSFELTESFDRFVTSCLPLLKTLFKLYKSKCLMRIFDYWE